jgi:hypothetical protein
MTNSPRRRFRPLARANCPTAAVGGSGFLCGAQPLAMPLDVGDVGRGRSSVGERAPLVACVIFTSALSSVTPAAFCRGGNLRTRRGGRWSCPSRPGSARSTRCGYFTKRRRRNPRRHTSKYADSTAHPTKGRSGAAPLSFVRSCEVVNSLGKSRRQPGRAPAGPGSGRGRWGCSRRWSPPCGSARGCDPGRPVRALGRAG